MARQLHVGMRLPKMKKEETISTYFMSTFFKDIELKTGNFKFITSEPTRPNKLNYAPCGNPDCKIGLELIRNPTVPPSCYVCATALISASFNTAVDDRWQSFIGIPIQSAKFREDDDDDDDESKSEKLSTSSVSTPAPSLPGDAHVDSTAVSSKTTTSAASTPSPRIRNFTLCGDQNCGLDPTKTPRICLKCANTTMGALVNLIPPAEFASYTHIVGIKFHHGELRDNDDLDEDEVEGDDDDNVECGDEGYNVDEYDNVAIPATVRLRRKVDV